MQLTNRTAETAEAAETAGIAEAAGTAETAGTAVTPQTAVTNRTALTARTAAGPVTATYWMDHAWLGNHVEPDVTVEVADGRIAGVRTGVETPRPAPPCCAA